MNYLESIAYLESLSPTTLSPCLERVEAFMQAQGRLQDRYASIHVGGTNGKGSTVAMLDSMLRASGRKTGRFTGPHLLRWNERFHVNGEAISDQDFAELATRVRQSSEDFGKSHPEFGPLTWFEFLTVMAFIYFFERGVDIAVFEVGLGGRWDATNVLSAPLVSAITKVDLDHTQILGSTVEEIAREKAGIIKASIPIVTAATGNALAEIQAVARATGAPLYHCIAPYTILRYAFDKCKDAEPDIPFSAVTRLLESRGSLSLAGSHQQLNALVAFAVLAVAGVSDRRRDGDCDKTAVSFLVESYKRDDLDSASKILTGAFRGVYWPGRMQYLDRLNLLLDGAHNPAGASALRQALDELFPQKPILFVLGCFQNKDVPAYIRRLLRKGDRVLASEASTRRAVFPAEEIVAIASENNIEAQKSATVEIALKQALEMRRSNELVVATGSFATVREVMLALGWQRVEDGLPETKTSWLVDQNVRASNIS
jgi:dihydrofolate synthase/folylpolyglutamate synthase